MRAAVPAEVERRLVRPSEPAVFTDVELDGLPDPVCRYLRAAIAPGTPLAAAARFRMHGQIKLGRWLPFQAEELLAPHQGFHWAARAAGVVSGFDRYAGGQGQMRWRLLGLVPVMRADGPDLSRSAAGRVAGEAMWVPTALLPRCRGTTQRPSLAPRISGGSPDPQRRVLRCCLKVRGRSWRAKHGHQTGGVIGRTHVAAHRAAGGTRSGGRPSTRRGRRAIARCVWRPHRA